MFHVISGWPGVVHPLMTLGNVSRNHTALGAQIQGCLAFMLLLQPVKNL
jgi:hypothetical protein